MQNTDLEILTQNFKDIDAKSLSPLVLAYIGDAVYEIVARFMVLSETGNAPVNKLNKKAQGIVNAKAQNDLYFNIENILTEEEMAVFKRGRNAKSFTTPKNGNLLDYRHATGLEALFGYLYLLGKTDRIVELFKAGIGLNNKGE